MHIHFATTLMVVPEQILMRQGTGANVSFTNFDFERRNQRGDKLELTNGTNVFAEARPAKERINGEGHEEIVDDQPSRPDWFIPETEDFVAPKEQQDRKSVV